MINYKPKNPLVINGNGIFPLTTYDQIILSDGSHWTGPDQDEIYIGSTPPSAEKYNLWVDTSEDSNLSLPKNQIIYLAFSINPDSWRAAEEEYKYEIVRSGIRSEHAVFNLTIDSASQGYVNNVLNWATEENKIIFLTGLLLKNTVN